MIALLLVGRRSLRRNGEEIGANITVLGSISIVVVVVVVFVVSPMISMGSNEE